MAFAPAFVGVNLESIRHFENTMFEKAVSPVDCQSQDATEGSAERMAKARMAGPVYTPLKK